jgi:hypothetical protein
MPGEVEAKDTTQTDSTHEHLVQSDDPNHPANLIGTLCKKFHKWGWVRSFSPSSLPTHC